MVQLKRPINIKYTGDKDRLHMSKADVLALDEKPKEEAIKQAKEADKAEIEAHTKEQEKVSGGKKSSSKKSSEKKETTKKKS